MREVLNEKKKREISKQVCIEHNLGDYVVDWEWGRDESEGEK